MINISSALDKVGMGAGEGWPGRYLLDGNGVGKERGGLMDIDDCSRHGSQRVEGFVMEMGKAGFIINKYLNLSGL